MLAYFSRHKVLQVPLCAGARQNGHLLEADTLPLCVHPHLVYLVTVNGLGWLHLLAMATVNNTAMKWVCKYLFNSHGIFFFFFSSFNPSLSRTGKQVPRSAWRRGLEEKSNRNLAERQIQMAGFHVPSQLGAPARLQPKNWTC